MVFSGLTAACRRARLPTRRSPDLVNAATEGVVREPSELGMTTGSPPSMTAITELVVPRSIPTVFGMCSSAGELFRSVSTASFPTGNPAETPAEAGRGAARGSEMYSQGSGSKHRPRSDRRHRRWHDRPSRTAAVLPARQQRLRDLHRLLREVPHPGPGRPHPAAAGGPGPGFAAGGRPGAAGGAGRAGVDRGP